ncbi:MAG: phosphatidate cytidylyltransferase [Lachnospiraceae bacterium]|nr:phosphatidate cytidylyltransferase [Lachnospiraceae bacterium]
MIRFRSSVILMIITVAAVVLGGYVLWSVSLIVTLIGLMELYRAVGVNKAPVAFVGYLASIGWYVLVLLGFIGKTKAFEDEKGLALLVVGFLIVLLGFYVFQFPKHNSEQITMVFFGLFYVAFTLSCIFRLRISAGGAYTVWLIFIGSWGADTSAYLVGRKIGKHKIVPVLSPKKSLEGFIGGIFGAILIGVVYAIIFRNDLSEFFNNPIIDFAIISAAASVVSMIGDLAASAIKRDKQIKDYGRLIPGHGGILDRFDSVIFIAPIVYYLVMFLSMN